MIQLILLTVVFLSVGCLAFSTAAMAHSWLFRYRMGVQERLLSLTEPGGEQEGQALTLFNELSSNRHQQANLLIGLGDWLTRLLERAGLSCSLRLFLVGSAGSGLMLSGCAMLWSPWLALLALPLGALLPLAVVYGKRNSRQRKLTRQLPEVFQIISRAVGAGQTVPAALRMIAEDYQSPVKEEFALCYEQQDLGMSRDLALRKLADRTQIMELQIFVVALLVQTRSGGDLVELLDNLAGIVRKRMRLKNRIRALTGEGRMQALVLIVLPILAFVAIFCFSPDYASLLLERPYLLAATAVAQVIGAFWIHRIVNFEY
ncbi:type II secretion system F family protein [Roseimaritima ulvae]|uniref:Bacterial type II secretion system protein F domain protein n=1 Tax=Roseimaritima ulvae TaxID=980254 RepID=A0A5B9QKI1_9BACT|nr:type II secretion system F family protein [Roseimaritima ulvae]QEG39617.1 Bacterial type II secretion system protein F domain protein [Roseimaritima ulvae]